MLSKELTSVLAITGIALLLFVLVTQHAEYNSLVRARINVKEPFENAATDLEVSVTGITEMSEMAPGPADIADQRQPYHLLRGVLPDAPVDAPSALNAKTCYESDFANRFQKTESYLQRTNNYKRASPDNCSAPLSVLVNSFYKNDLLS
jgi:hypothetical protein